VDFGTILRASARSWSQNVAVWCEGREQTYGELFERACRLANALTALGCVKGDRVALVGPNGAQTVEQVAGIALGGFVRVGLYAHQTGEVNAYLLDLVGARVLIADHRQLPALEPYLTTVPTLEHVVVYGAPQTTTGRDYEQWLAAAGSGDPRIELRDDDVHVIRFSAGTTGRPKGIYHTVGRWLSIGDEYRWVTPQIDDRDSYLAAGPLTHAAVIFLWPMLQVGGRIVVIEAFEPELALRLIQEQRITFTLMVPTMIQALVNHAKAREFDLSSLRCLNYAASPISETTMTNAVDLFGPVLFQMYGQSEAVPITMLLAHQHRPRGSERERRWMRSVGRPTPNTKITIVDEDANALPIGEVGEVAAQTPGSMSGLWNDPEGTARRTLKDGSVLTRDMGRLDHDGFLYLADRKEDMIISGGYNIWPAELENAVASHPAVAEVCVVGVPHDKWGETPKAVVVLDAHSPSDSLAQELISLTRERVGSVQKVTSVEFVDSLPKSGVGKVLRREVRERYWPADPGHSERVSGA
jgi:acyl-CoA synthetase (AMP-forming)/AMP-acid ligase II